MEQKNKSAAIEREAAQIEKDVATALAAGNDELANQILENKASGVGLTAKDLATFKSQVDNGLPVDAIISKITEQSLPIWLKSQLDNTEIASGYHEIDDVIGEVDYENGNVTFDYQKGTKGDGKTPYFGSIKGGTETLTDIWTESKLNAWVETWMATKNYHKTVIMFKPLYTAAHKSTALFLAQYSNMTKRMGEAFLQYMLAYKGRVLWLGESGLDGIVETNDGITFTATPIPAPDITINADNIYNGINQINNLVETFRTPSEHHFDAMPTRKAQFAMSDGTQLVRSLPDIYTLIMPRNYKHAIDMGVRAGAFNMSETDMVIKNIKSISSYKNVFGSEYANLTGLNESMIATDKDVVSGTVDMLLITPDTYQIINQYQGTDTVSLGNFTSAVNMFYKKGFALQKYENKFIVHIRMVIGSTKK